MSLWDWGDKHPWLFFILVVLILMSIPTITLRWWKNPKATSSKPDGGIK